MFFNDQDYTHIPHPDPAWHYCWAPQRAEYLAEYLMNGFTFVLGDEAIPLYGSKEIVTNLVSPQGRIVYGDSVLVKLPKGKYEEMLEAHLRRNAELVDQQIDSYYNAVDQAGNGYINAFCMKRDEYLDRREFETRDSNNRVVVPRKL